jgi:hypothetical protein
LDRMAARSGFSARGRCGLHRHTQLVVDHIRGVVLPSPGGRRAGRDQALASGVSPQSTRADFRAHDPARCIHRACGRSPSYCASSSTGRARRNLVLHTSPVIAPVFSVAQHLLTALGPPRPNTDRRPSRRSRVGTRDCQGPTGRPRAHCPPPATRPSVPRPHLPVSVDP